MGNPSHLIFFFLYFFCKLCAVFLFGIVISSTDPSIPLWELLSFLSRDMVSVHVFDTIYDLEN